MSNLNNLIDSVLYQKEKEIKKLISMCNNIEFHNLITITAHSRKVEKELLLELKKRYNRCLNISIYYHNSMLKHFEGGIILHYKSKWIEMIDYQIILMSIIQKIDTFDL